jgi:hypothetical protein
LSSGRVELTSGRVELAGRVELTSGRVELAGRVELTSGIVELAGRVESSSGRTTDGHASQSGPEDSRARSGLLVVAQPLQY